MYIPKKVFKQYIEPQVLRACHLGSDVTNYDILLMLPTTTYNIISKIGLTKMPAYRRLNTLKEVGLISWQKGTTKVGKGFLTDKFLAAVETIRKKNLENILKSN